MQLKAETDKEESRSIIKFKDFITQRIDFI